MTNRELIQQLLEFPLDSEVRLLHYDDFLGTSHNPLVHSVENNSTEDYQGIVVASRLGKDFLHDTLHEEGDKTMAGKVREEMEK